MDPDALKFLEAYAQEREVKLSSALSELLLHLAGKDKVNPVLVNKALERLVETG